MTQAYDRPYRPMALDAAQFKDFNFQPMIEQLSGERSLSSSGRASLTLVHGEGLTAVLTVARSGSHCEPHDAAGPTLFVVLNGALAVCAGTSGERVLIEKGGALAVGARVRHEVDAESDCAFLTVIGEQEPHD